MPKAYWVVTYQSVKYPEKVEAYRKIAPKAMERAGGRFLARSDPAAVYEAGKRERVVLVEFDSLEAAMAAHEAQDYGEALKAFGDGAVRDFRIVEGV